MNEKQRCPLCNSDLLLSDPMHMFKEKVQQMLEKLDIIPVVNGTPPIVIQRSVWCCNELRAIRDSIQCPCNDCNEIDIDAENERQQEREFERIQRSIETDPSC